MLAALKRASLKNELIKVMSQITIIITLSVIVAHFAG